MVIDVIPIFGSQNNMLLCLVVYNGKASFSLRFCFFKTESCYSKLDIRRRKLELPSLHSGNLHVAA